MISSVWPKSAVGEPYYMAQLGRSSRPAVYKALLVLWPCKGIKIQNGYFLRLVRTSWTMR